MRLCILFSCLKLEIEKLAERIGGLGTGRSCVTSGEQLVLVALVVLCEVCGRPDSISIVYLGFTAMSTISSSTDDRSLLDDSEFNFKPGYMPTNYRVEVEKLTDADGESFVFDGAQPYTDEPLADENWTRQYEMRQAEKRKRLESLHNRFIA